MKLSKDAWIIGGCIALMLVVYLFRPGPASVDAQPSSTPIAASTPHDEDMSSPVAKTFYKPEDLDFSLAENAVRYRKQVAATLNAIIRSNHACADVDAGTLISKDERPSSNPAMQIACKDSSGTPFAVQFHAKDAANGMIVAGVDPISEDDAGKLCQRAISAKFPSNRGIALGDAYFQSSPGGKASVVGAATSGDQSYRVVCRFKGRVPTFISVDRKLAAG